MTTNARSAGAARARQSIATHMAREDWLGLHSERGTNFKKVAEFLHLSKEDLSNMAGVSKASVRFDANIPEAVATRLREIANIANLVAEYFNGDANKVSLWFELANPMLGNISPRNLIRAGRYQNVLNFVMEAREEERATEDLPEEVRGGAASAARECAAKLSSASRGWQTRRKNVAGPAIHHLDNCARPVSSTDLPSKI